jgi:hypothetical protein
MLSILLVVKDVFLLLVNLVKPPCVELRFEIVSELFETGKICSEGSYTCGFPVLVSMTVW